MMKWKAAAVAFTCACVSSACGGGDKARPNEALRAGDDFYRQERFADAEASYREALAKATAAGLDLAAMDVYWERVLQILAQQGKLQEAEELFARVDKTRVPHLARRAWNNFAVLHFQNDAFDTAARLLLDASQLLEKGDRGLGYSYFDEESGPALFVVRANLDRVYWAAGERDKAREIFQITLADLGRAKGDPGGGPLDAPFDKRKLYAGGSYRALPPALRAPVERYIQFLRAAERNEAAGLLEQRVQQIDELAKASPTSNCVALRAMPPMGCLLEIQ